MIKLPLISVIIPCYNQARYLAQAIDSVLAQSYSHFEIIVVNDGSTDNIHDVLLPYLSNPKILLHNQPNMGLSFARNVGIDLSHGDFVQFLDSDDWLAPNKFQLQLDLLLADPSAGIAYCNFYYYYEDSGKLEEMSGELLSYFEKDPLTAYWLNPLFPPGAVLVRREWVERTGEFRADLPVAEDFDYWLRAVALGCKLRHLAEPLAYYRRHSQNLTGLNQGKKLQDTFIKIRQDFLQAYPWEAAQASYRAFEKLNEEINLKDWDLKVLREQLLSARHQLDQKEADLKTLQTAHQSHIADAQYHYHQLQNHLQQLENNFQQAESYALSLKAELDKLNSGKIHIP